MTERNPLIKELTEDTLLNIHVVTTLICDLHSHDQFADIPSRKNMHIALSLILRCTNDALEYEITRIDALRKNNEPYIIEA